MQNTSSKDLYKPEMFRKALKHREIAGKHLICLRFNGGVSYHGRTLTWDTIIEEKTNELGRFLTMKSSEVDFVEPSPALHGDDSREMRAKILALTSSQAKQLGIGKSTLYYLRENASCKHSFTVYQKTLSRLK